jgi:hypothetical protein
MAMVSPRASEKPRLREYAELYIMTRGIAAVMRVNHIGPFV